MHANSRSNRIGITRRARKVMPIGPRILHLDDRMVPTTRRLVERVIYGNSRCAQIKRGLAANEFVLLWSVNLAVGPEWSGPAETKHETGVTIGEHRAESRERFHFTLPRNRVRSSDQGGDRVTPDKSDSECDGGDPSSWQGNRGPTKCEGP